MDGPDKNLKMPGLPNRYGGLWMHGTTCFTSVTFFVEGLFSEFFREEKDLNYQEFVKNYQYFGREPTREQMDKLSYASWFLWKGILFKIIIIKTIN